MLNEEMSAGTNAEQSTNDETRLPSSPTIGNTHVVRSPNVLSAKSKLENKVKVYEWFYGHLESLIKSANLALNRSDNATTYVGHIKLKSCVNTNTKKGKGNRH